MPEKPQGYQELNNKNQPIKRARCPLPSHIDSKGRGSMSSNYLGEQQTFDGEKYWSFSCHHGGKPYHVFQAIPDPLAPRTEAEYPAWLESAIKAKQQKKPSRSLT